MKQFLLAALATVTAVRAHAGSISLDLRADYNSTTYSDSNKSDSTRYVFKLARVDYQGKVNEDLSFRFRAKLTKTPTVSDNDSAQSNIEYGYLSHKLGELFTLSVGKLSTEFGGFEGAVSGADRYLTSEFFSHTALVNAPIVGTLSPYTLGTNDLLYNAGVKGTFAFEGQQFHVLATNEPVNTTAVGPASTQNSSLYGVAYRGAFIEKALSVVLSYHTMAGPVKDDKHQFMVAGIMWNSAPIMASAEYLVSEFKQDASGNKDALSSIVAKLAYTGWEHWTPRLEFTSSEDKQEIDGNITNKFQGMGAVLEFKPYNEQTFRYHVAYQTITEKPETGVDIKKEEVVVGARLLADFLK